MLLVKLLFTALKQRLYLIPISPAHLGKFVNNFLGTGDREQVTGNREQVTGDREQGTGKREEVTGNRGQGTGNREEGRGKRFWATLLFVTFRYFSLLVWFFFRSLT
jgi:hypothetical protein